MDLSNKVVTIEDEEYLVISCIEHKGKYYVYLVNKDNQEDTKFREVVKENDDIFFDPIDAELFQTEIFDLFNEDIDKE